MHALKRGFTCFLKQYRTHLSPTFYPLSTQYQLRFRTSDDSKMTSSEETPNEEEDLKMISAIKKILLQKEKVRPKKTVQRLKDDLLPGGISLIDPDASNPNKIHEIAVEKHPNGYKIRFNREFYLESQHQNEVVLPNEYLAHAIVSEWEMQGKHLVKETLILSELASKTQDIINNPEILKSVREDLANYFETEPLCYRIPLERGVSTTQKMKELFDPILDWFMREYNVYLRVIEGGNFRHDIIDEHGKNTLKEIIENLKPHELAALHFLVEATESIVCSFAILRKFLNTENAVRASHFHIFENLERTGVRTGDHEITLAEKKAKIAAASLFVTMYEQ